MNRKRRAAVAVLAAVAACGCANVKAARERADLATERFHLAFNHRDFDAIYVAAGSDFRKTGSKDDVSQFLDQYWSQLGLFDRITRSGLWSLNWTPAGTFVTQTVESRFANGSAQETFVWRIEGSTATLRTYTISNVRVRAFERVATRARANRRVRFMPFRVSGADLNDLRLYYKEQLDLDVEIVPELVADQSAWTPQRRQWSAEGLAEQARQAEPDIDAVTILVTGEDIYLRSSSWLFAFGYRADNQVAVVSCARMDPRFFGQRPNVDVLRNRLRRMVTKDLGVMLYGLEMSPDPASPVYGNIDGVADLDAMGDDLASSGFPVAVH